MRQYIVIILVILCLQAGVAVINASRGRVKDWTLFYIEVAIHGMLIGSGVSLVW
jgi:hypothetical protein